MMRLIRLIFAVVVLFTVCAQPACCAAASGAKTAEIHRSLPANPRTVRTELKDILSRPEYNRVYASGKTPDIFKRISQAIVDALLRLAKWFASRVNIGERGGARIMSITLALIVIIAFLVLLALVIRKLVGSIRKTRAEENDADPDSYELLSTRPLIKEAARLAQSGDYRGAFRCAYLASISHLDESRALRFERDRTNWEYLRELQRGGFTTSYQELHPLTLAFDRKFYGREQCTRQDYENAVGVFERISREGGA